MKPTERIISWILQIIIIVVLADAAYLKLSNNLEVIQMFSALGMEPAGRYIIGFLEAAACGLLLLPNAAVHGAILTFGIMLGAIIAHCSKIGFEGITPWAAVILVILSSIIIYLRRMQIPSIARMID